MHMSELNKKNWWFSISTISKASWPSTKIDQTRFAELLGGGVSRSPKSTTRKTPPLTRRDFEMKKPLRKLPTFRGSINPVSSKVLFFTPFPFSAVLKKKWVGQGWCEKAHSRHILKNISWTCDIYFLVGNHPEEAARKNHPPWSSVRRSTCKTHLTKSEINTHRSPW